MFGSFQAVSRVKLALSLPQELQLEIEEVLQLSAHAIHSGARHTGSPGQRAYATHERTEATKEAL
jgi:hypothetical protein